MTEITSTPFTPYMLQRALGVKQDGQWGPETEAAMRKALGEPKDNTGKPWIRQRLVIAYQQKLMKEAGIKVEVDGLMGPETLHAFELWQNLLREPKAEEKVLKLGVAWAPWRTIYQKLFGDSSEPVQPGSVVLPPQAEPTAQSAIVVPNRWPRQADVPTFYGKMGANQVIVPVPWQMQLAWDSSVAVRRITLHAKVADSAKRCLDRIYEHYGDAGVKELGLHKFGGSLNVRKMRGSNAWSMHSWGIAIDWDPDRNALRTNHVKARLAQPDAKAFWEIWESEGWVSLGRERDYDWMHVQAARL